MRARLAALFTLLFVIAACGNPTEPREAVLILQVAPETAACTGPHGPRECLQVRESVGGPWLHFFDEIEGFTYEPGFLYTLEVSVRRIPNPPQDSGSFAYRLISVVSQVPAG